MSRNESILVVDVGNTSIAYALYTRGKTTHFKRSSHIGTTARHVREVLEKVVEGANVVGSVLCSVVPDAESTWHVGLTSLLGRKPLHVSHRLDLGVRLEYPRPETLGQDRLANICGAAHRFQTPVVVADFGTALTLDVVKPDKGYVGGIIAPGLSLMFGYLAEKTALLPSIEPRPIRKRIGKSTLEAMQIGARNGYRGMVRELVEQLRSQPGLETFTLCVTGGDSEWVMKGLDIPVKHVKDLTLLGCGRLYELNPDG